MFGCLCETGSLSAWALAWKYWAPKCSRRNLGLWRHPLLDRLGTDRLVSRQLRPTDALQRREDLLPRPGPNPSRTQRGDPFPSRDPSSMRAPFVNGLRVGKSFLQDGIEIPGEDDPGAKPTVGAHARHCQKPNAALIQITVVQVLRIRSHMNKTVKNPATDLLSSIFTSGVSNGMPQGREYAHRAKICELCGKQIWNAHVVRARIICIYEYLEDA